jgi:protein XRP2
MIKQAIEISNNAYKVFYRKNPNAERYNLCLAMSSRYVRAGLLIARLCQVTCKDFPTFEDFFSFLQSESGIVLYQRFNIFNHLTTKLDEHFDSIFSHKMAEISRISDSEEWMKQEQEAKDAFIRRTNTKPQLPRKFQRMGSQDLIRNPGTIAGQDFTLDRLHFCNVYLMDEISKIECSRLNNCKVYIGPVKGECCVANCRDCSITVACKRLRVADCMGCTFYLFCDKPISTTGQCQELFFAPYNFAYSALERQVKAKWLIAENNCWGTATIDFGIPISFEHVTYPAGTEAINPFPLPTSYQSLLDSKKFN